MTCSAAASSAKARSPTVPNKRLATAALPLPRCPLRFHSKDLGVCVGADSHFRERPELRAPLLSLAPAPLLGLPAPHSIQTARRDPSTLWIPLPHKLGSRDVPRAHWALGTP
jgi:hypothetical protein